MMLLKMKAMAYCAFLCGASLFFAGPLFAQAPPGPITPSQPLPPPKPAPPPKKKPEVAQRKTLAGYWKLNTDESDDAKRKLDEARQTRAGGGNGPNGPGGPGGSGNPGGGNGRVGVGFPPIPGGGGGNGPYGGNGRGMGGGDSETSQRIFEQVRPDSSQSLSLMDAEVDSLNDRGNKMEFFTDGRKIQKSKNDAVQEISAHWDGQKLVTDEKGPQNKKMSRTIELSPDGRQFYETWHVENGKSGSPIAIRYVYDAANENDE